jgi:hypothetical protein
VVEAEAAVNFAAGRRETCSRRISTSVGDKGLGHWLVNSKVESRTNGPNGG